MVCDVSDRNLGAEEFLIMRGGDALGRLTLHGNCVNLLRVRWKKAAWRRNVYRTPDRSGDLEAPLDGRSATEHLSPINELPSDCLDLFYRHCIPTGFSRQTLVKHAGENKIEPPVLSESHT